MQEIADLIYNLNNKEDICRFLEQLLTPTEQEMVLRRWQIVKQLHQGVSQREIAKNFKMSLCNVTRGAKELKKNGSMFKMILEKDK